MRTMDWRTIVRCQSRLLEREVQELDRRRWEEEEEGSGREQSR